MNSLNLYVIDRTDGVIKGFSECFEYQINRDYLTNEKSRFMPFVKIDVKDGDFLYAKTDNLTEKILYFGIIESFQNSEILCCDLYNIANFEIVTTKKSGTSYGMHIQNLLNFYLDSSKLVYRVNRTVDPSSNVNFAYIPKEPIETKNFIEYLIDGFKKYGVIWEVTSVTIASDQDYAVNTTIKKVTDSIQIKANSETFINWEVYDNETDLKFENRLLIVNKNTNNSEAPGVLSTWYLKTDGTLTQNPNDGVFKPTKDKIYIYDLAQSNPPSYQEVAQSNLAGRTKSHEINFDLLKTGNLISLDDIKIGMNATISYDGKIYNSVLTGYEISSQNDYIHLRFGFIRSVLNSVLNKNN